MELNAKNRLLATGSPFHDQNIKVRAKGQRADPRLLGPIGAPGLPEGAKAKKAGTFEGVWHDDGTPAKCQAYEVTLPDGTVVPAYSKEGHMIVQHFGYKSYKKSADK